MESTLFTTLTATEEASLSGGWKRKHDKKPVHKPSTTTPPSTPVKLVYAPINVNLNTQIITVVNTGNATKGGSIIQIVEAANGNA